MRVLVTGASGFIGSHVTKALINAGHEILILAKPSDSLWRLRDISRSYEILRGSLNDLDCIKERINTWQPKTCIHLAWYAEPGLYLNSKENIRSLHASLELLQLLTECDCKQFVGAGTCAEYERSSEMLSETDKTRPKSLYAATKLAFQMIAEQVADQNGIGFSWGRIFYLYGSHEDPRRLVASAIIKLLKCEKFPSSSGQQIRDYLNVTDVANAFLALMEQNVTGIFNICSSKSITIHDLLETIGKLTGKSDLISYGELPYKNIEPMVVCGNNYRLRSIGWSQQVSLQNGLLDTINWWKAQVEKTDETNY